MIRITKDLISKIIANSQNQTKPLAEYMAEEMSKHTRNLMTRTLRGIRVPVPHQNQLEIPKWLT